MEDGVKYLITTSNWFFAPDGQNYKAVWGTAQLFEESIFDTEASRQGANWYVKIGSNNKHCLITGCQIHYAVRCENRPSNAPCVGEEIHEGKLMYSNRMTRIYIAE